MLVELGGSADEHTAGTLSAEHLKVPVLDVLHIPLSLLLDTLEQLGIRDGTYLLLQVALGLDGQGVVGLYLHLTLTQGGSHGEEGRTSRYLRNGGGGVAGALAGSVQRANGNTSSALVNNEQHQRGVVLHLPLVAKGSAYHDSGVAADKLPVVLGNLGSGKGNLLFTASNLGDAGELHDGLAYLPVRGLLGVNLDLPCLTQNVGVQGKSVRAKLRHIIVNVVLGHACLVKSTACSGGTLLVKSLLWAVWGSTLHRSTRVGVVLHRRTRAVRIRSGAAYIVKADCCHSHAAAGEGSQNTKHQHKEVKGLELSQNLLHTSNLSN